MLPELGAGQQRAITYLWAATQVAATVVRNAFVQIYTSLPNSGGGHTSIMEYCRLTGRSDVYLELLDEGYLSSQLSGSPKDAAFLDLKVTRKMLEKVLAAKFSCGSFGKLVFEVRRLVYLRNDLCHQLLPSFPADQYLACMHQLETRLCTVTRLAALIADAATPPNDALHHIHALFASLLNPKDDLSLHSGDRKPRSDNTTKAHLHQATVEEGVQADTTPRHHNTLEAHTRAGMDSQRGHTKGMFETIDADHQSVKTASDSPHPGTWKRLRSGLVTHGIDGSGEGRRYGGRKEWKQSCYHNDGCGLIPLHKSKNRLQRRSNGTSAKGNKSNKYNCHNTETSPAAAPFFFPGRSLCQDNLGGGGVMTRTTQGNRTSNHALTTLSYTAITMNHVTYMAHKWHYLSTIVDGGLSVVLMVILLLGTFSASTLPLVLTLVRLAVCGLQYSCVQVKRVWKHLSNLCSGERPREAVCIIQEVLIPRVAQEELCGPAMVRSRDDGMKKLWNSDWNVACRRKKRTNTNW